MDERLSNKEKTYRRDTAKSEKVSGNSNNFDLKLDFEDTSHIRYDFCKIIHSYISYLNKLEDDRANYLIVGNSLLLASTLVVWNSVIATWQNDKFLILSFCGILTTTIISIVCAVIAIKPKTFDADSPIHSSAIAKLNLDTYQKNILSIKNYDIILALSRENHVVSRIVEYKSKWVTVSVYAILIGIGFFALFVVQIVF